MTRLFPQPGDRRKEIKIENVGLLEKRISECERRQNHICKIDQEHPLLPIALDCLNDEDIDHPNAQEIHKGVGMLKKMPKYGDSVREVVQWKHETTAASVLEIENVSKQH